jgi:hypothetical protein
MLLHHETYRLLVQERMNHYLREAAMDRRANIAAVGGERVESGSGRTAARLLRAVVRMLVPHMRERGTACGETGRGAR